MKINIRNKGFFILLAAGIMLQQCRITREIQKVISPEPGGLAGLEEACIRGDTLRSMMIREAEAWIVYEGEQYEVSTTLYVEKDSIIYLSAVKSGFEILRASIEPDSIKVIDRMNRVVYRTAMYRKFGYQHPFTYGDLQNLISRYFFCREISHAKDDFENSIAFEMDQETRKRRIIVDRDDFTLQTFEFYHRRTDEYLMGEKTEAGLRIFSNFIIGEIEIIGRGGITVYNHHVDVKMEVNPRRYSFIDLQ
ncbi:MAG: DUF4292 domain-containing protein [Bacteroidales bacterium]